MLDLLQIGSKKFSIIMFALSKFIRVFSGHFSSRFHNSYIQNINLLEILTISINDENIHI